MDAKESAGYLKTPKAIREQCRRLYDLVAAGKSAHFKLAPARLPETAAYVLAEMRTNYPSLDVPYHSRWRHFNAGGTDRLARLEAALAGRSPEDIARSKIELAIVSVLLDAGAGPKWSYKDADGKTYAKSEGLAVASLAMFLDGGFSSDPDSPYQVDPGALRSLGKPELSAYFQVSASNPLAGFDGRLNLLHKLGDVITQNKKVFGDFDPRLGSIFDYLATHSANAKLPARKILGSVLESLGPIWPGRINLGGTALGDAWTHPALPKDDLGAGVVPFHKLSQWLSYSLVEPMEEAGFEVGGLDDLTGLAEYRNGGLFLDMGVIVPQDPRITTDALKPDDPAIIEWRALTICLLDDTAGLIRTQLGLSAEELPLAKVLEGGTWAAGRRIAAAKRADGGPPIKLHSDGTVF